MEREHVIEEAVTAAIGSGDAWSWGRVGRYSGVSPTTKAVAREAARIAAEYVAQQLHGDEDWQAVPPTKVVEKAREAFIAEWHLADREGDIGNRARRGVIAALDVAYAHRDDAGEELRGVVDQQAAILTEAADHLHNDKPEGVMWSHHDVGYLAGAAAQALRDISLAVERGKLGDVGAALEAYELALQESEGVVNGGRI